MSAELLAVLLGAVLLSAISRRYNVSSPLILVVAGLAVGLIPAVPDVELDPELVLFVVLPPLLWSAGLESSYVSLRRNFAPISALAVGLPLATTFAVGFVAYRTVPELTLAAALVLGAIVAPPDAVSATAIGRRLGLSRRTMTLLGGESLLNDATALTAYKVTLGLAIGMAESVQHALGVFAWAVAGGVLVGFVIGKVIVQIRSWLDDSVAESAIGLLAPFVIYLIAEEVNGSGVLAVVVAALILGHRSTEAGYATRLQDDAVWRAVQLLLESFAFLLIGLQLPQVVRAMEGIPAATLVLSSAAVTLTVLGVRIAWVFGFTYLVPHPRREKPTAAGTLVVAWAGMRGVVSLAAAFGVPLTTLSGAPFPGRPYVIFLTFVVVVGTLLLHGLTLPWLIRRLGVSGDEEAHSDALAIVAVRTRAAEAADRRLEDRLARARAAGKPMDSYERAAKVLREWNRRRRNEAWEERLGRGEEELGPAPSAAFRRLRLDMLAAERETFVAERDADHIDDEVLRTLMRDLDLQEATLNR
ncbi:Na+/H+ antiporter [Mycobacterium sp. ACS4331]|uniref:Na+/H+ antiporter n=1 Tax=Mycobacterium sp. ACS4331 TaxID=1834121 RepID=UPI0007FF3899|nr:Na+/H+ antiporter [Mycobacterium sp. ACS4331]OBF13002.1 Na+/H+ antiporter [Mycobacterium sp. ACS4331]